MLGIRQRVKRREVRSSELRKESGLDAWTVYRRGAGVKSKMMLPRIRRAGG